MAIPPLEEQMRGLNFKFKLMYQVGFNIHARGLMQLGLGEVDVQYYVL